MELHWIVAGFLGCVMVCYIAWMGYQLLTRKREPDDGSDVSGWGR